MRLFRSLSLRILAALVAGLLIGAAIAEWAGGSTGGVADVTQAVGALWLGALQMTVVPLVLAVLVTGIAQASDAAATGRLAARAVGLFLLLLGVVTTATLVGVQGALDLWPVNPTAAAALTAGAGPVPEAVAQKAGFAAWLGSLTPGNPVRAAAENAMLPLVLFGVFFGFAATRITLDQRTRIVGLFDAIAATMIVIVRWVLWAAPVGVFALAMALALRSGVASAGALLHYVVLVSAACLATLLVSYPLAILGGRVSPPRFIRAVLPVQAVAFSTQSSLGSLPIMIERARDDLHVSERTAGVVLPLAVAIFRITSPVANLSVALFMCHVAGFEPSLGQLAAAGLVAVAVSIGTVGLPGQVSFFASMAPISLAMGAPMHLLPLLLAVEVVPDIFRTVGNVTADMAVTTALARDEPEEAVSSSAGIPS